MRLLVLITASALLACGGVNKSLEGENHELSASSADLRAKARRDRRAIRDLEHQVALLKQTAGSDGDAPITAVKPSHLRVEVVEPDAEELIESDYEVVGMGDRDVEVIYIGEAASDEVVSPSMPSSLGPARVAPASQQLTIPAVGGGEQIPVTKGVGPTVAAQLGQASRQNTPLTVLPAKVKKTPASSAKDDYKRYYTALRAGNHAYAITGFRNFVSTYPSHDYADNAQYWLGEAFYDQRDFAEALKQFRTVVDRYPLGNKVSAAELKMGYCLIQLGDVAKARKILSSLISKYPNSSPAKLAAERLEGLE